MPLVAPQPELPDEAPWLRVPPSDSRSRQQLARVCRFLMDAGRRCLLAFFERRHPASLLKERLASPDVYRTLRRLKIKGLLDDADWSLLYPTDKSLVSANNYSLRLLLLLVKYACDVERPAPGGWSVAEPTPGDRGHGAAVVRLLAVQRDLASAASFGPTLAARYLRRIADLLELLEDPGARGGVEASVREPISSEEVDATLEEFADWYRREVAQLRAELRSVETKEKRPGDVSLLQKRLQTRDVDFSDVGKRHSAVGKAASELSDRSRSSKWSHIRTGMVQQERSILEKYYDRLLEEVKADGVVEHLAARGVLSNEESTEIFATLRNNEQMSTLLEFLVQKSGNFFDDFLEALEEKNEQLHQQIQQDYLAARAEILANKPQGLPYCHQMLKDRYVAEFGRWNPTPWYASAETDIVEFYCQQQLLNLQGKPAEAFRVFEAKGEDEKKPLTVVIEGDPGVGKSTLAKYMAARWAADQSVFGQEFKLLILLDLKVTAATARAMMMEQLFGSECKLAEREIWEVMEMHQEETLLILDGYEDNLNEETRSLVFERLMPELRTLVFSQTNFTVRLMRRYQRKFILTGFAKNQAQEYVLKYAQLTKQPRENFASFLDKLATPKEAKRTESQKLTELLGAAAQASRRTSAGSALSAAPSLAKERTFDKSVSSDKQSTKLSRSSTRVQSDKQQEQQQDQAAGSNEAGGSGSKIASLRHYSQVPLYCSFFCLLTDMRMGIDLNSPTTIVEQFVSCAKLRLIEREKESRFETNRASVLLAELAMDTMRKGSATFLLENSDDLMAKFGLVQSAANLVSTENRRHVFANRLIQEYLAAKHLDTAGNDVAGRFFQSMSMTPSSYNVVVFYCSIRKGENDTSATRELFSKILNYNKRRGKAALAKLPPPTSPDDSQLVEGRIMEYQLSLECAAVIDPLRRELGKNVAKSLPGRFVVKHEGIIPRLSLIGLSKILRLNHDAIQEVDILLDLLAKETLEAYMDLAGALKENSHVRMLRIYWTEKDLMADFLKVVCCSDDKATGGQLQNLECIDESGRRGDQLTPKVLGALRDACGGMTRLCTFAFKDCRHQTLVGTVVKHLPTKAADSLRLLDFSGCGLSVVASQDLNTKLVESKTLQCLVLANLRIDAMAFNTFIEAFGSNRTVVLLDLSGIRMDNVCFFALSEALKVNNKLERLVLQNVQMDARACKEIARILKSNKSLKLLQVTEEAVAEQGRPAIGQECQSDSRRNRAIVDGIGPMYKMRPAAAERSNTQRCD